MTGEIIAQLALGVGSSVITGVAVWLWQRARRFSRVNGRRRFLGLAGAGPGSGQRCRLVLGQYFGEPKAIHRRDVAAMLEIATLVRSADATAEVVTAAEAVAGPDEVEFCVGGPEVNTRAAAHLARYLPGVTFGPARPGRPDHLLLTVAGNRYLREPAADHAVLARVHRPERPPLFLIAGQGGVSSHAAAAHLAERLPALRRRFGDERSFCLVLRVVAPAAYGHREVEEAADATGSAFAAPPGSGP